MIALLWFGATMFCMGVVVGYDRGYLSRNEQVDQLVFLLNNREMYGSSLRANVAFPHPWDGER